MRLRSFVGGGVFTICMAAVLAASVLGVRTLKADEDNEGSKIRRGFEIAPVTLNLKGKNRALVGLGSYIVNSQGECDGCHSAGPQTQFVPGFNPYLGESPAKINPDTYLGGGNDFGAFPFPASPVHIVSRNLTPTRNGTLDGDSFEEFLHIIRTGKDPDHLHPIIPGGIDGSLLQIMPWPAYREMTDRDLRAIYEYLGTIPCLPAGSARCQ